MISNSYSVRVEWSAVHCVLLLLYAPDSYGRWYSHPLSKRQGGASAFGQNKEHFNYPNSCPATILIVEPVDARQRVGICSCRGLSASNRRSRNKPVYTWNRHSRLRVVRR